VQVIFSPDAQAYLAGKGTNDVTVSSLVFTSCCSGPLPPEVKPGAPTDPEGFHQFDVGQVTLFYDSLLDPRSELLIDLKNYGSYRELFAVGWE
jgi:hypothetical protein